MSSWASTLWWKRVTRPWTNVHFTCRHPHQYNHIHSTLHQQVQAVFVIIVRANGGATQELLAGVFGGQREVPVLLQVGSGNDGHQAAVFIHNRKFAWKRNMDSVADGFWWKTKHTKGCANKRVSKFLNIFTCANFIHGQDLRRQSVGVQVLNIYEGISPTTGLGCTLRLSQLFLQVRVRLDFCLCAKNGWTPGTPESTSPFLLRCRISLASFSVTPAGAITRSSRFVITCQKGHTQWTTQIKIIFPGRIQR